MRHLDITICHNVKISLHCSSFPKTNTWTRLTKIDYLVTVMTHLHYQHTKNVPLTSYSHNYLQDNLMRHLMWGIKIKMKNYQFDLLNCTEDSSIIFHLYSHIKLLKMNTFFGLYTLCIPRIERKNVSSIAYHYQKNV